MHRMRLVVLDGHTLNPGDLNWEPLRQLLTVEIHERTQASHVVERAQEAELVLTNKVPLPAEALRQLPKLRYIGVTATGYNIVDTAVARERGITVTNVPEYGTMAVAQFTFALLLELCHSVGLHSEAVRQGAWQASPDWCFWRAPLVELAGKTMGVVGYGRIGQQVTRIAQAFGMRAIAARHGKTSGEAGPGVPWVPLEQLLSQADVVSLHCPLTPETEGILNAERLALLKPTALLINTSRGGLIKEQDLAAALHAGQLAGAAVDVLPAEPPTQPSPLFAAPRCLVTPHIAWAAPEARARLLHVSIENVEAFLRGRPIHVVA